MSDTPGPLIVFDVETQKLFEEVAGARSAGKLGLSVAASYNADTGAFHDFTEQNVEELIDQLFGARLVVGYNTLKFDYAVLKAYTDRRFNRVPSLDIFDHVYRRTNYRSKLDTIAFETLAAGKSGDGREAVVMWREGRVDELLAYCRDDVRLTYELYQYGKEHGAVFTRDPRGRRTRVPIMW